MVTVAAEATGARMNENESEMKAWSVIKNGENDNVARTVTDAVLSRFVVFVMIKV